MDEMSDALPRSTLIHPMIFRLVSQQQHVTELRVDQFIDFHSLLDVLDNFMEVCGEGKPTSFEYEDEEGDRITVRSDEEMNAMIDWHQHYCDHLRDDMGVYHLTIYPKVGKTATRRNTLGLTVDINTSLLSESLSSNSVALSGRKCSEGIETILRSEQILHQDIQYLNVVGHGNGGTVHKAFHIPSKRTLAVKIVKGLQYLWSLKIMHRDVKPSNILVNSIGEVKLCDFGVSIQLVNSIAKTYVGTNAYMAPERIMGDEYGIHSDVWSLGLSLVEMSTGKFPYPLTNYQQRLVIPPIELLQCIVNEQPPSLSTELFGDALRDFVQICLKKNPKDRPTPQQLSRHRYILQNDTENLNAVVAEFVNTFNIKTHDPAS